MVFSFNNRHLIGGGAIALLIIDFDNVNLCVHNVTLLSAIAMLKFVKSPKELDKRIMIKCSQKTTVFGIQTTHTANKWKNTVEAFYYWNTLIFGITLAFVS